MKSLILLLTIFSLNTSALEPTFSYHLEITVDGDGVTEIDENEIERDGWEIDEDQWGDPAYILGKVDVVLENGRLKENLSDVEFIIRQTIRGSYKACLGIGVGDWDASAEGCIYLRPGLNILYANGGNHAGGSWGFDGKAVIHWK